MLFQISPTATDENAAILLNRQDNIAIARILVSPGQRIQIGDTSFNASETIQPGHKLAVSNIAAGDPVFRYGEVIGFARVAIPAGSHVHEHNLQFRAVDHAFDIEAPRSDPQTHTRTFRGFLRDDGRVGTRNYIAVVAASNCAAHTVDLVERSFANATLPANVDGVVAFPHGDGCASTIGPDTQQLQRTLEGVLDHPNIAAAIIIGLGCEVNQIEHYLGKSNNGRAKSLIGFTLQESGGTSRSVTQARAHIEDLMARASAMGRTEVPASFINLGLNCGGSDSFSGITANPALGYCCDCIAHEGGTVVLAETTEIFGAEHILARRAKDKATAKKLLDCVESYKTYLRQFVCSFNDIPTPGNKKGGLTNIV